MELARFIERYPRLFHMAELGTWESIKSRGLLSTSAVLDLFGIAGAARSALETQHRPEKVTVGNVAQGIVLRDQIPMAPGRLVQGLSDGLTPSDWYKLLNAKVFLWAREHRLVGLLRARHYRRLEHDVLTIQTSSLVEVYSEAIWLCPMNSGNTFPIPHPRGASTFRRIADYPTTSSGMPVKEIVEVVVDHSIPDIAQHVVAVRRMRGDELIETLQL
jgi:hypothetical protein